jgi:peptide chain release factor 1
MFDRLEATEQRYEDLTAEMARPEISADYERLQALAKERASIEQVVSLYREWRANAAAIESARGMLGDADAEMASLARAELEALTAQKVGSRSG